MADGDKKDDGIKRKLDDLSKTGEDEQSSTEKTDEDPAKKIKTPRNDGQAQSTSQLVTPAPATSQGTTTLISGAIYRVQCPELGDFHVRAGATGGFCVKAVTLVIDDAQGNRVFPLPNSTPPEGTEVEVKDNLNNATTVTVLTGTPKSNQTPAPTTNSLTSTISAESPGSSTTETVETPPLQIVGLEGEDITINIGRSVVITGRGGRLVFGGTGTLTVNVIGSLQKVVNTGTGAVKVNGDVTAGLQVTSSGSIEMTGNVTGRLEEGTCGGSIVVKDVATGEIRYQLASGVGNVINVIM